MPSQRFFTAEAADYLLPLLDKERDAAEIADLRATLSRHRQTSTGHHAGRDPARR